MTLSLYRYNYDVRYFSKFNISIIIPDNLSKRDYAW